MSIAHLLAIVDVLKKGAFARKNEHLGAFETLRLSGLSDYGATMRLSVVNSQRLLYKVPYKV